jgi:hypothetical protein
MRYDRYVNEIGLTVSVAELLTQLRLFYICIVTSCAAEVYKTVSFDGNRRIFSLNFSKTKE